MGVADHAGWAVLVTVAGDGTLLDRRRVELVEAGLPVLPHHHEAQRLPVAEGVALVEQVRESARACARAALDALAAEVPGIVAITLRDSPPLPPTVAERIARYRAQCVADGVMYRDVLAEAARAKGWAVHRYDRKDVFAAATRSLGEDVVAFLDATKATAGRPWRADHRLAMAAAIAARPRRGAG